MNRTFFAALVALGAFACGGRHDDSSTSTAIKNAVVTNGSFETLCSGQVLDREVAAGHWNAFYDNASCPGGTAIPGWFAGPNGVEVQVQTFGPGADGVQYIELDPFHPSSIWQDVVTYPDALYKLSVAYRMRPDNTLDDGEINVKWNDALVIAFSKATPGSESWVRGDAVVLASGPTSRITLEDASLDNEYGGLIDDVQLTYVGCMLDGAQVFDTAACDARRK